MSGRDEFTAIHDADIPEVTALAHAVNWPHRREDVGLLVSLGHGLVLRASDTGEAMAVGMWWPFDTHHARLGMIIVHPKHQGSGLGRKMVTQLLKETADRSVSLLATTAGKPLYESFGFRTIGSVVQIQGELGAKDLCPSSVREAGPEDLSEIVRFDKAATGLDRSSMLSALIRCGRIAIHETGGYGIERSFGKGSVVGPIVSETEKAAIELFTALARPGFVRVDCVSNGSMLQDHLVRQGLHPVDADAHIMLSGSAPPATAETGLWALASHALG